MISTADLGMEALVSHLLNANTALIEWFLTMHGMTASSSGLELFRGYPWLQICGEPLNVVKWSPVFRCGGDVEFVLTYGVGRDK
jgi:hypothetical protein